MSTPPYKELVHDEPDIVEVLLLTFAPTTPGNADAAPHVTSATLYLLPRPRLRERLEELLGSPVVGLDSGFIGTLALCKSPNPALLERWRGDAATSADGEDWTLCPTSMDVLGVVAFVGRDEDAAPLQTFAPLTPADVDSLCSLSQLALDEVLAFFGVKPASVRFAPPEPLGG